MKIMKTIKINEHISVGLKAPFTLIAGPCVIESKELVLETGEKIKAITERLGMNYILKSSYTKDNRSKVDSFRGPGLEKGLEILAEVKSRLDVPVLSDIHSEQEAKVASQVLDVLQIPAYLCMQTSLLQAAGKTGKAINVKKGQFVAPYNMQNVVKKIETTGNENILVTERGTFFGYNNLVVDMTALPVMARTGYPVVIDPTHAIREYGQTADNPSLGRPEMVPVIARSAVAAGCQAIFIETHPDCSKALCDAATMWPLDKLETLLIHVKRIHDLKCELDEKYAL